MVLICLSMVLFLIYKNKLQGEKDLQNIFLAALFVSFIFDLVIVVCIATYFGV